MEKKHAEAIEEAAFDLDLEISAYPEYSGRGMMGRITSGVVGSIPDILCAVSQATRVICVSGSDSQVDEFIQGMKDLRIDNMGRKTIVY